MSTHALPANLDRDRLRALLAARLREPSGIVLGSGLRAAPTAVEFTPDLSLAEQTTLADLLAVVQPPPIAAAAPGVEQQDRDAFAAIDTQWQTYLDTPLASITGAMTVTTVKQLVRVMRYVLRRQG